MLRRLDPAGTVKIIGRLQASAGNSAVESILSDGAHGAASVQRQPTPGAPSSSGAGRDAPPVTGGQSAVTPDAQTQTLISRWLEQHQFAPPEQQPGDGEQHVLLNGEDMTLSGAVQLGSQELRQPADVVRAVIVAGLAVPRPLSALGAPIVGRDNLIPGLPLGGPASTGLNTLLIQKMLELETIDHWLQDHNFGPPAIRDPSGDRALLDGQDTTIEEIADRALALVGGDPHQQIRVAFLTRQEILVHLRQRYVAARGGPSTQITFGITVVPRFAQAGPSPLRTQGQFSFTITRAHHAGDSPGAESSFQGGVTVDDTGGIVNVQAGGQEAIVVPLLRGWIQVSGFVQLMMSANWSRSASGSVTIAPALSAGVGAQVLVTPPIKTEAFELLNGHAQLGVPQVGIQGGISGGPGAPAAASAGIVLNIPLNLL